MADDRVPDADALCKALAELDERDPRRVLADAQLALLMGAALPPALGVWLALRIGSFLPEGESSDDVFGVSEKPGGQPVDLDDANRRLRSIAEEQLLTGKSLSAAAAAAVARRHGIKPRAMQGFASAHKAELRSMRAVLYRALGGVLSGEALATRETTTGKPLVRPELVEAVERARARRKPPKPMSERDRKALMRAARRR
jgi:hypothetical protein